MLKAMLTSTALNPAKHASAACLCGKVSIGFVHRMPLVHLECACQDCRQAREYEATLSGPPSSSPLSQLFYFSNDVILSDTLASNPSGFLESTQLRDGGRSTRLVARCCRSTLAVDHPAYGGNIVMVPGDSCNLDADSGLGPLARIYMGDWDLSQDGEAPPCTYPSFGPGAPEEAKEIYRKEFRNAAVKLPRVGESAQALFEACGPPKIHGLPAGKRF